MEVRVTAFSLARQEGCWNGLRIGLIVPRFKHSAVARNKIKRRLRELIRLQMLPDSMATDVVLRIRPEAYGASFDALAADIGLAVVQMRRWQPSPENDAAR